MSRGSLRRELFHKNIDILLQQNTLETLTEEPCETHHEPSEQCQVKKEQVTDLDAEDEPVGTQYRSPIYRPAVTTVDIASSQSGEVKVQTRNPPPPLPPTSRPGTVYTEPWSPHVTPGTPYTEIAETPVSKKKPTVAPLKFQFPDPIHHIDQGSDLPFSPITREPGTSVRTPLWSRTCNVCHEDDVRALPMSPALYLSQSTSTPAPIEISNQPLCQSIMENSIFSQQECNMCRICHEDGSKEQLVSPCHCTGTMGMLHMSCLEQWLGSSNTTKCEICQFQFVVLKKPRPLKWYMREPSLKKQRIAMIKDLLLLVNLGVFVLVAGILCIVFAERLAVEEKHGPATVLILLTMSAIIMYSAWSWFALRRIRYRFLCWHRDHHEIMIKQRHVNQAQDTSNKLFRRFPSIGRRSKKKVSKSTRKISNSPAPAALQTSTYISYSLESYKAAMFNPVTPPTHLLQDDNNNDITSLDTTSPSVISLDDEEVTYYQPPEPGSTSAMYSETGRLLRETGV